MSLTVIMKLFHVLAAFGMVTGVIGRNVTFARAAKATEIQVAHALLQASDFFERRMVIPVSSAVLLFGLATAWLQKWPILGFIQGGSTNWVLVSLILFTLPLLLVGRYLLPRRKQREKAAEAALALGQITPELTAALNDRLVLRFRAAEMVGLGLIVALMVLKPF
jgi:predicted integral membrane protein DUF2269